MAIRDRLSHHVHPADRWPLFDFSYSACTAQHGRLHFSLDLLIADALSMRTLQQELMMLYREPHVSLPLLPFSFRDYVQALLVEQASEAYARDQPIGNGRCRSCMAHQRCPYRAIWRNCLRSGSYVAVIGCQPTTGEC